MTKVLELGASREFQWELTGETQQFQFHNHVS